MSDISITAANVQISGNAQTRRVIAGGAITRGQPVYQDAADSFRVKACDADVAASAVALGIALADVATGQPVDVVTADPAFTPGGTTVAGTIYVASPNAGGIAPWADLGTADFVTVLGVGLASNKLHLRPIVSGAAIPA